jgi:hypothetical protein
MERLIITIVVLVLAAWFTVAWLAYDLTSSLT